MQIGTPTSAAASNSELISGMPTLLGPLLLSSPGRNCRPFTSLPTFAVLAEPGRAEEEELGEEDPGLHT